MVSTIKKGKFKSQIKTSYNFAKITLIEIEGNLIEHGRKWARAR
jgi:hypothetical protein